MASATRILKYPQELTNHLKKLSAEKEDECKIYAQWDFSHTEDSGEADSQCPCGKTGIRYLCYITNKITKEVDLRRYKLQLYLPMFSTLS